MSEKIEVIRLKPCELRKSHVFRLNYLHRTELGDFVVLGSDKANKLYVNENVPVEDVEKFQQFCSYEGDDINDDDCPIADVNDYLYKKYGWSVWSVLSQIYDERKKRRKKAEAQIIAEKYLEQINEYRCSEDSDISFYNTEYVLYALSMMAIESGGQTANNLVGLGTEYAFLLGYMMGKGIINKSEG